MVSNDKIDYCIFLGLIMGLTASGVSLLLLDMQRRDVQKIRQKYYRDVPYGYNVYHNSALSSDGTTASAAIASTLRYLNERQTEDIVES